LKYPRPNFRNGIGNDVSWSVPVCYLRETRLDVHRIADRAGGHVAIDEHIGYKPFDRGKFSG